MMFACDSDAYRAPISIKIVLIVCLPVSCKQTHVILLWLCTYVSCFERRYATSALQEKQKHKAAHVRLALDKISARAYNNVQCNAVCV